MRLKFESYGSLKMFHRTKRLLFFTLFLDFRNMCTTGFSSGGLLPFLYRVPLAMFLICLSVNYLLVS